MSPLALLTLPMRVIADLALGSPDDAQGLPVGQVTAGLRPCAPEGWRWGVDGLLYRVVP